ncbi:MAG: hypothetical protein R3E86_13135 [Pseudomonadales bacterium]
MATRRQFSGLLAGCIAAALGPRGAHGATAPYREGPTMFSRVIADIQGWDRITDHRTGTAGDAHTARWLADAVRAAGVEPLVQSFPFRRRVPQDCRVRADGQWAEGVPLFDGGYTDAAGLRGRIGALGSDAPIGLARFSPFAGHPENQRLERARREGAHKAIVAVALGEPVKPGLALLNADDWREPFGPPVLQVATEEGAWLDELANAGGEVELTAYVTFEDTEASNVEARIEGSRKDLAPLVIMTPRSAWWICTSERGGGITVWLECLRRFADEQPERTVLFTANTGHELGHVGLERYLEEHQALIAGARAWLHLGANFAARGGRVRYQASDAALLELGLGAIERSAGLSVERKELDVTPVQSRPYGEARNIYDGGGQYVSLLGDNPLFHHPDDRWPEAVDVERTAALTEAMLDVASTLARA